MSSNSNAKWTERSLTTNLTRLFNTELKHAQANGYTDRVGEISESENYTAKDLKAAYADASQRFARSAMTELSEAVDSAIEERDDAKEREGTRFDATTEPEFNVTVEAKTEWAWKQEEGEDVNLKESTIDFTATFETTPYGTKATAERSYPLSTLARAK